MFNETKLRYAGYGFVSLILLHGVNMTLAQHDSTEIKFSISAQREVLLPGEPCALAIVLENVGTFDLEVDLGTDGTEAFRFETVDANGKTICRSSHTKRYGLSRSGKVSIPAGRSDRRQLVLNEWCTTLLPPGEYGVTAYLRMPQGDTRATCQITIEQIDEARLSKTFSDLAATVLSTKPFGERMFASRMLSRSDSPLAVMHLAKVVRESPEPDFRMDAVKGLGHIGTLQAVQELVSISLNEGDIAMSLRSMSLGLVKRIHGNTKSPEIRDACAAALELKGHGIVPKEGKAKD